MRLRRACISASRSAITCVMESPTRPAGRRRAGCALACTSPRARRAGARGPAARPPRAAAAPTAAAGARAELRHQPGIRRVGFGAGQTTARIGLDDRGIDDTDDGPHRRGSRQPVTVGARGLQARVHRTRVVRVIQPRARRSPWRHRQRLHADARVGQPERHIELPLGDVNSEIGVSIDSSVLATSCADRPCAFMLSSTGAASRPSDLSDVRQRAPGTLLRAGLAADTPTSVTKAFSRRPGSSQAMETWKSHKPRFPLPQPSFNSY